MILGLGIDLTEVARIRASYERFGDRFVRRVFRDAEIEYCLAHRDPAPYLAARFSAKEAVSKAFGTGIGAELGWHDIEVVRLGSGQPTVRLHDRGVALLASRGGRLIHLSLTHTVDHAAAVAVIED